MAGIRSAITSFLSNKLDETLDFLFSLDLGGPIELSGDASFWLSPWGFFELSGLEASANSTPDSSGDTGGAGYAGAAVHAGNLNNADNTDNTKVADGAEGTATPENAKDPKESDEDESPGEPESVNEVEDAGDFEATGNPDYVHECESDRGFGSGGSCESDTDLESAFGSDDAPQLHDHSPSPKSLTIDTGVDSPLDVEPLKKGSFAFTRATDKFVTVRDAGQACCGLVVSKWTIDAMNKDLKLMHATRKLKWQLEEQDDQVELALSLIEGRKSSLETRVYEKSSEDPNDIMRELEQEIENVKKIKEERRALAEKWEAARAKAEVAHNTMFLHLSGAIERADLMESLSDKDSEPTHSVNSGPEVQETGDEYPHSEFSSSTRDGSSILGLEELHRETVRHALSYLGARLDDTQAAFDRREEIYWENYSDFGRDLENDEACGWTWDDWHASRVEEISRLTRELTDVEDYYVSTKREAKRLGLWDVYNDDDASSGFFDQEGSCGYAPSEELEMKRNTPGEMVESWIANVEEHRAADDQKVLEGPPEDAKERWWAEAIKDKDVDEWDAESLDFGVSIGDIVDIRSNRKKIGAWRELCERRRP